MPFGHGVVKRHPTVRGVNTIEGKGLVKRHPPVNLTDRGMGPMRPRWIDLTVGVRFFSDTPLRKFRRPTHHRHPCKSFVELDLRDGDET